MGKKGREIVEGNVDQLIDDLKKAYADEWIAVYYYTFASQVAEGRTSPLVINGLKDLAKDELEHQDELANRIVELGGEPIRDFAELVNTANCSSVSLPADPKDLDGIINGIVEAERCAIDIYSKLLKKIKTEYKDPITFHIIRHIMQEEVGHEETFEDLL